MKYQLLLKLGSPDVLINHWLLRLKSFDLLNIQSGLDAEIGNEYEQGSHELLKFKYK